MRIGRAAVALVVVEIAAVCYVSARGGAAVQLLRAADMSRSAAPRTVWDSVFSSAQAQRGEALYRSACSSCHGPELTGNDDALPLTGPPFMANWNGQSIGDLFDKVRHSMPPDEPGTLDPQQTVDVIAHILNFNKFPAGGTELANDPDALKQIVIQSAKPAGSGSLR